MSKVRKSVRLTTSASAIALTAALNMGAPAQASDPCGTPVAGSVQCEPGDAPFPDGIVYSVDDDLTLDLADGLTITPDPMRDGIVVSSSNGSVVINAGGSSISTIDAGAIGIHAGGNIDAHLGDIHTEGLGAWGITTYTFGGDTNIEVDRLSTHGDYGLGIVAQSSAGNIRIAANEIDTLGFASDGITVKAGGSIDLDVGSISGEGDYLWGINATSANYVDGEILFGDITADVGNINITGDHAVGVFAQGLGNVDAKVDQLAISGDYGNGVIAIGLGLGTSSVNVEVGDAEFTGNTTGGIAAVSYGEASVKVGHIKTENGGGVTAYGLYGAHAEADKIEVNGDFADGIQSVSNYGNASISVADVSSNGFYAIAVNGDAMHGHLSIDAGTVKTQGYLAMGIRAFGGTSEINLTGSLETSGDMAFGILNSTTHGDAVVRTLGPISTAGNYAEAMWVTGRYGTADIVTNGKVETAGDRSIAIRAVGEDGQIRVDAADVSTSGANSDGINARTRYVEFFLGQPAYPDPVEFSGDIDIQATNVTVSGQGSIGISAKGLGAARITAGSVVAADNYAIETDMIEDSQITVTKLARSDAGSAIFAGGQNVTVDIASGASVIGGVDGIVVSAMGDRCTQRNSTDGSPNPCPNPGGAFEVPDPSAPLPPPGFASIDNAGLLQGGEGYAVRVASGTVTLRNSGVVRGAVLFGDGDDLLENSGSFYAQKDSDFGDGADLFKNSGTLKFATATAPKVLSLKGLEQFQNAGTIDLRNGIAGDNLRLSGDYAGDDGAILALDLDLSAGSADKLTVAGAATGSTQILLGLTGREARLTGPAGLVLVEVGEGSSRNAFSLAGGTSDIGLVRYGLAYDQSRGRFMLQSAAGTGAYRQLNALEGATDAWHQSADAWRANALMIPMEDSGNGPAGKSRLWGGMYSSVGERDGKADLAIGETPNSADYSYDHHRMGGQMGFDLLSSDGHRIGLTGGYEHSQLNSRLSADAIKLRSFNLGAYASFRSSVLFGNLLAKFDRHRVALDADATGFDADAKGTTWGLEGEIGARFGKPGLFVEPVASISWTRTDLGDVHALGQRLQFDALNELRTKIGVNAGGLVSLGQSTSLSLLGSAKLVGDFGQKARLTLFSGESYEQISSSRATPYGEGSLRVGYHTGRGLETFVQASGTIGSDIESIGGTAGVRIAF